MTDRDRRQIKLMAEEIVRYRQGRRTLSELLERLWGLFEAIEESTRRGRLDEVFHRYWDHMEELYALGISNEDQSKIDEELVPKLLAAIENLAQDR